VGYVGLLAIVAVVIAASLKVGYGREPNPDLSGLYRLREGSACVGDAFLLQQSGEFLRLRGVTGTAAEAGTDATVEQLLEKSDEGAAGGSLRLEGETATGEVRCRDGSISSSNLRRVDGGLDVRVSEEDTQADAILARKDLAEFARSLGAPAAENLDPEETFGRLMLAVAAVILAARLFGALLSRIGQPRVMGEVLAGILLGPTLLGRLAPVIGHYLFPPDVIPLLGAGADIGLAFYMFLVGLELEPETLKGRVEEAAFISHGSIAIPMALGIVTAVPIYRLVGPSKNFIPFALFMGVSMSITAFPVLARILLERRMLRHPVGAMAIGAAAVDDVTAWGLLALATAFAGEAKMPVHVVVGLAVVFCVGMTYVAKPLLARVAVAYDEAGHVPAGWIAAIFVGVLLSAFVSARIGIAAIFGAFVMGLIMPRHKDLTHDVARRLEDFVVTVLLPLFFVVTGLRTDVGVLDRPQLWGLTVALILVAVLCKWAGAMGAARYLGFERREAGVIGALMNTRGLTELIVLNIGLSLGVITPALFTMLVLMALVTTFMTGPALRMLDPKGELTVSPEDELRSVEPATVDGRRPAPERAVLVAPQDDKKLAALLTIAERLARSVPPREIIIARVLAPRRSTTGAAADAHELARVTEDLQLRRRELAERNLAARAVAFTSTDVGRDLARLAREERIDFLLIDGRRPLLGEGVPRGEVGLVLEEAPCDVAVMVDRDDGVIAFDRGRPIMVPFGGGDHDWAALELAAWICSVEDAPLKLLGVEADLAKGTGDASRLLADASLVIQQFIGVAAEPVLMPPGEDAVIEAAQDAALLVVGLSDRWRQEGLGAVRSAIARGATPPKLFVRRGFRPGALAPRDDVTRFSWSAVAPARERGS
jgi:Kef-type K+ transport system membrane component KefB